MSSPTPLQVLSPSNLENSRISPDPRSSGERSLSAGVDQMRTSALDALLSVANALDQDPSPPADPSRLSQNAVPEILRSPNGTQAIPSPRMNGIAATSSAKNQSLTSLSSGSSSKKRSQDSLSADSTLSSSMDEEESSSVDGSNASPDRPIVGYYRSTIDCGWVDPATGQRHLKRFEPWFGTEVEVYTAANDPVAGRPLYRASALAAKFNCATNKVGMYLSRRRKHHSGIFQAAAFTSKPQGRTGLKCGGYFLSLEICRIFEQHFIFQSDKREKRERRRSRRAPRDKESQQSPASSISSGSQPKTPGDSNDPAASPQQKPPPVQPDTKVNGHAFSSSQLRQRQMAVYGNAVHPAGPVEIRPEQFPQRPGTAVFQTSAQFQPQPPMQNGGLVQQQLQQQSQGSQLGEEQRSFSVAASAAAGGESISAPSPQGIVKMEDEPQQQQQQQQSSAPSPPQTHSHQQPRILDMNHLPPINSFEALQAHQMYLLGSFDPSSVPGLVSHPGNQASEQKQMEPVQLTPEMVQAQQFQFHQQQQQFLQFQLYHQQEQWRQHHQLQQQQQQLHQQQLLQQMYHQQNQNHNQQPQPQMPPLHPNPLLPFMFPPLPSAGLPELERFQNIPPPYPLTMPLPHPVAPGIPYLDARNPLLYPMHSPPSLPPHHPLSPLLQQQQQQQQQFPHFPQHVQQQPPHGQELEEENSATQERSAKRARLDILADEAVSQQEQMHRERRSQDSSSPRMAALAAAANSVLPSNSPSSSSSNAAGTPRGTIPSRTSKGGVKRSHSSMEDPSSRDGSP